jgi:hypothetical protein
MRHVRDPAFLALFNSAPARIQETARKNFELLKRDPKHPSLHFKRLKGDQWSVRIGRNYRALALEGQDSFHWYWIGSHDEYKRQIDKM